MRPHVSVILSLGAAVACAGSSSSAAPGPAAQPVLVSGPVGGATVVRADNSSRHTMAFASDKVWRALPAAFDSVGVPIETIDPAKRMIGNSAYKLRGRLKGVPLSRYIDCGNSTQIGPNADNYDVALTLLVTVQPGETGSSIVTADFSAVAKPANFAQEYSQCASKSTLEAKFFKALSSTLER